jgi:anti-sigma factor RsiW
MLAMTCRDLTDFLMAYLDGELPSEVRAAFDHHLSLCTNCVAYVKTYRATVEMGRRAFDDDEAAVGSEVPVELVRAILAAKKPEPSA